MIRFESAHLVGTRAVRVLGAHRSLRGAMCVTAFALASIGCGAAGTPNGSTLPTGGTADAAVRALACGTYTQVDATTVAREGELATVPFLEVVLGDADPCDSLPLIVVLHGLGGRPVVPRWPYRDLPVAVRIVLPQGPIPWGSGYAWSSVRTLDHEPAGLEATIGAQSDRVAAFLDAYLASMPVRGDVVLVGFSQGAILALTMTMQHPAHVGLVLPLAGWVPEALRTDAGEDAPHVRWLHGLDDERIPYSMALEAATDLRGRGYDVELIGYPGAHHEMSHAMNERFHSWLSLALENIVAAGAPDEGFVLVP